MGYVPPPTPHRLRFDRFGMPLDYPTYMWQVYGVTVADRSPQRMSGLPPQSRPRLDPSRDTR